MCFYSDNKCAQWKGFNEPSNRYTFSQSPPHKKGCLKWKQCVFHLFMFPASNKIRAALSPRGSITYLSSCAAQTWKIYLLSSKISSVSWVFIVFFSDRKIISALCFMTKPTACLEGEKVVSLLEETSRLLPWLIGTDKDAMLIIKNISQRHDNKLQIYLSVRIKTCCSTSTFSSSSLPDCQGDQSSM